MSPSGVDRRLQRLEWTVIRRLDGLLQGDYRTIFKGHGIDLADIREYVFGDDVRHIDWNVTARLDTPYVREYLEDREISGQFLLDLSPSVDFGTVDRRKRDLVLDFTAGLARLLTRHGNRIGATIYGSRVERAIPTRGGRVQVLRILNELERRPRLERAPLTSLAELLDAGMRSLRRRSLVFVVSDFFSAAGWEARLERIARRHETLAIRLIDPRESELPDIGPVVLTDSETGEQLRVDTHDRRFRERFTEAARRREERLARGFARAGVDGLLPRPDEALVRATVPFAVARPQAVVAVPSQEGTVILAIDVSGSMLAEDMKPNRIEAAKAAARAFVDKQSESVKIGVVSFSGDASIVQSPTTDKGLVIAAINRLRPQRATAIGRAILVSLDAIAESQGSEADLPSSILQQPGQPDGSATPRPSATIPAYLAGQHAAASIVLLSDGQNNQFPAPLDIVDQASSRGVRIYTIGVGSAAGAIVRLQGRAVRTALDETTLKKIAEITDGQYFNANTEADLRAVYENLTTELVVRNEKTELTAYATLAAAVLAVFAGAFSLLWFNRLP